MISFNASSKISRQVLLTATAIFLFASAQGAVARGGGNSGDHGGMRGHESGDHNEGMKTPDSHRQNDRGNDGSNYSRKREERHHDADERTAKIRGKDKDKAAGPLATSPPGTASNNTSDTAARNFDDPAAVEISDTMARYRPSADAIYLYILPGVVSEQ